jgi:hypothetical protein
MNRVDLVAKILAGPGKQRKKFFHDMNARWMTAEPGGP